MVNEQELMKAANARAGQRLASNPTAVAARYDRRVDRVVIALPAESDRAAIGGIATELTGVSAAAIMPMDWN